MPRENAILQLSLKALERKIQKKSEFISPCDLVGDVEVLR